MPESQQRAPRSQPHTTRTGSPATTSRWTATTCPMGSVCGSRGPEEHARGADASVPLLWEGLSEVSCLWGVHPCRWSSRALPLTASVPMKGYLRRHESPDAHAPGARRATAQEGPRRAGLRDYQGAVGSSEVQTPGSSTSTCRPSSLPLGVTSTCAPCGRHRGLTGAIRNREGGQAYPKSKLRPIRRSWHTYIWRIRRLSLTQLYHLPYHPNQTSVRQTPRTAPTEAPLNCRLCRRRFQAVDTPPTLLCYNSRRP